MDEELEVGFFQGETPEFELKSYRNGHLYWYASELMNMLGYEEYSPAMKPIQKALQVCLSTNIDTTENFIEEWREIDGRRVKDFKLTRFACYLIAMNSDTKKQAVANAQTYFASLTAVFQELVRDQNDIERVTLRQEITEHEKSLTSTAKSAGIQNYAFFQNKGYMGLYNMSLADIRRFKNLPTNKPFFDFMGSEELGANIFRITQTEAKIKREKVRGQRDLESTAFEVGKKVRQAIREMGGEMPEHLPSEEAIQKIRSDLKKTNKHFEKNDRIPLKDISTNNE